MKVFVLALATLTIPLSAHADNDNPPPCREIVSPTALTYTCPSASVFLKELNAGAVLHDPRLASVTIATTPAGDSYPKGWWTFVVTRTAK